MRKTGRLKISKHYVRLAMHANQDTNGLVVRKRRKYSMRRDFTNARECRSIYFDFLDLVTTFGPYLPRRDIIRIGKKVNLPEFANLTLPASLYPNPPYEETDESLRLETYYAYHTRWFEKTLTRRVQWLCEAFLKDEELTSQAFCLACWFLTEATRPNLTFNSRWITPDEHISGLKRADLINSIQLLIIRGYITLLDRAKSRYMFNGLNSVLVYESVQKEVNL